MNPAPHLVLVGPMGAGKTSIGRRLAERLGLPFLDLDHELEAHTGSTVGAIFDCEGEAGFRAREAALLDALLSGPPSVLATGGGAVLAERNQQAMQARGFVVYLAVRVDSQLQRLSRDRARPLLQTEDRTAVLERLATERGPLYAGIADFVFETDGLAAPDAARLLAHAVQSRWQRTEVAA